MKKNVEIVNYFFEDLINSSILTDLQSHNKEWEKKAAEIQACFDFTIPTYIIDEIIEKSDYTDSENLYCLINCAVINGKLSQENAIRLKEVY